MAYVFDPLEVKKNLKEKGFLKPQGLTLSTEGITQAYKPAGAPSTSAEQQGGGASSGASKFINFDRLLAANKPGSESMAKKSLDTAFERGQKAEQGVGKLKADWDKRVTAGTNIYSGGGWGSKQEYDSAGTPIPMNMGPGRIGKTDDPEFEGWKLLQTQGEADPNANARPLAEVQQLAQKDYTGPEAREFTQGEGYEQTQRDVLKGQQAAQAMGSQTGLEALMNELYGTAGGSGGSRLDAALARVAGGPAFQRTQERFKNLDKLLPGAAEYAQERVGQGKDISETSKQLYKQDIDALMERIAASKPKPEQPPLTETQQWFVDQGVPEEDVRAGKGMHMQATSAGSPNQGEYNEWYDYINPLKWFGVI